MGKMYPRTPRRQERTFQMDPKDARNAGQNGLARGGKGLSVLCLRCADESRQDMRLRFFTQLLMS